MKKYASEFNEMIVLAEKEKSKKKGGSMAAVLKLVQDLAEFESNIQEAMDAQEMAENRSKIESFLQDIDKMYGILLEMAKESIQAMRAERARPPLEESPDIIEEPAPASSATKEPEASPRFTAEELKKQLETKPSVSSPLTVPKAPKA